jgi:hypothetical protein
MSLEVVAKRACLKSASVEGMSLEVLVKRAFLKGASVEDLSWGRCLRREHVSRRCYCRGSVLGGAGVASMYQESASVESMSLG